MAVVVKTNGISFWGFRCTTYLRLYFSREGVRFPSSDTTSKRGAHAKTCMDSLCRAPPSQKIIEGGEGPNLCGCGSKPMGSHFGVGAPPILAF